MYMYTQLKMNRKDIFKQLTFKTYFCGARLQVFESVIKMMQTANWQHPKPTFFRNRELSTACWL